MKVAVISSSAQKPNIKIEEYLPEKTTMVITGGRKGIDVLAERYASNKGIPKLICPPKMFKGLKGKDAAYGMGGFMLAFADMLVAFWDGEDKVVKTVIDFAKSLGKEVVIHRLCPSVE